MFLKIPHAGTQPHINQTQKLNIKQEAAYSFNSGHDCLCAFV